MRANKQTDGGWPSTLRVGFIIILPTVLWRDSRWSFACFSQDFRQIPLVETSAHDNVNVENAFLAVAALIDPKCAAAKVKGGREKVTQTQNNQLINQSINLPRRMHRSVIFVPRLYKKIYNL